MIDLRHPIGRGAMGVVWRARDQLLDRDVAVKEVADRETLTDAERANAYQRTLREAKTAARLNHPGGGRRLRRRRGRRPPVDRHATGQRAVTRPGAGGLGAAVAAAGRADRPAAAVGARRGARRRGDCTGTSSRATCCSAADERAVLTDFGIATFQGDPRLTQTGMVMGSPGFTAPERIRGRTRRPRPTCGRSARRIYAAVEGRGPFEQRGGAITTMSAIINEDAPVAPMPGTSLRSSRHCCAATRGAAGRERGRGRMIAEVLPLLRSGRRPHRPATKPPRCRPRPVRRRPMPGPART